MPAEWESHYATWLGWPHNASDWPGKFAPIPWVYGEIVRALASGEIVRILVNSAQHERQARHVLERVGVDLARVEFFRFPTDRGDRKSTRLNSSHQIISYAVFCLKKKNSPLEF